MPAACQAAKCLIYSVTDPKVRVAREADVMDILSGPAPADDAFASFLKRSLPKTPFRLLYTDNARTMLSFSRRDGALIVRAHHMFASAPPEVAADVVAGYVRTRGRKRSLQAAARRRVQAFIEANEERIRARTGRRTVRWPGPVGRAVDLRPVAREVNRRMFGDALRFHLTFSLRVTRHSMGRWYPPDSVRNAARRKADAVPAQPQGQLFLPFEDAARPEPSEGGGEDLSRIVINRLLDHPDTPAFYLDYLLHHEMLHEHVYRETGDPRHGHRGLFARLEQRHGDVARAHAWEKETIDRLWRRARSLERRGASF